MKVVFCPVQHKSVECGRDGVCECAGDSIGKGDLCPVRGEALDCALNCC